MNAQPDHLVKTPDALDTGVTRSFELALVIIPARLQFRH
jgi:hypothetical protein